MSEPSDHRLILKREDFEQLLDGAGCSDFSRWEEYMRRANLLVTLPDDDHSTTVRQLRDYLIHSRFDTPRTLSTFELFRSQKTPSAPPSKAMVWWRAVSEPVGASARLLASSLFGRRKLMRPPGARLNALAEFLFSRKTYERVFQPTIRDLQDEYLEALALDRVWKARWVWFRGHCAFWKAFALQIPVSLIRVAVTIWKAAS